ncbi:unnamed protein product [Phytophthora fragariaefolia]|uniref:Unnamed protein product n=1 Tax=Phytophthora fragariaefolia TaxID=1490495 RepID=A0A9W7D7C1_9STRA|nr:unnamed protein product [Phytophthora fragariaefolia]
MSPGQNAFWSFDPRNAATPPAALPAVSDPETTSAPSRLSIATSPNTATVTAHLRWRTLVMEPKPLDNPRARDLLFEDSEEGGEVQVDYEESTDEAPDSPSRSTSGTAAPPTRDASPRVLHTPNLFPKRPAGLLALRELSELSEPRAPPPGTVDSAMEESVVTNDLDEAQSRQVALELQAPVSRRPVARPLLTRPRSWFPTTRSGGVCSPSCFAVAEYLCDSPAARTPEELAPRTALRECFPTPQVTSRSEYRERLRVQGQRGVFRGSGSDPERWC